MFSRTLSEENSAPCWNRTPQRRSMLRRSSSPTVSRSAPITSMRPPRFGINPMMVRVSTDLPAPDAPTKPRISPRRTSRFNPFSTRRSPNPTVRLETRMIGSFGVAIIQISGSNPDRGEEDGEHAIEHDDEEDRINHRGGGVLAERLGAAFHREPFDAGHHADQQRHERRLDHADDEVIERDDFAQPRQKRRRLNATVALGDQTAAPQRGDVAEEGKDRQADHERKNARQDQHL